jgi:hypothetical protein
MTFDKDDVGDLTAVSMIKNGEELLHNLNGKVGRDPCLRRSFYIDCAGSAGTMMTQQVNIKSITPNGQQIRRIQKGNDSSIARDTLRSGLYQKNDFTFDASLLKPRGRIRFGLPPMAAG